MTARVLPTAADVLRVLAVALTRPLDEGERREDAFALALCSVTERRQIAEVAEVLRAVADRVSPIGSVPPEVYARGVREAYTEGRSDGRTDPDGTYPSSWPGSSACVEAVATITAHGLTTDEAARVVAGVAS